MLSALLAIIEIVVPLTLQARPNVLLILADDLGFGDLSITPFNAHGIKTLLSALLKTFVINIMLSKHCLVNREN